MQVHHQPHRRHNPLLGEWLLVSPHRNKRPWQGMVEKAAREEKPHYDPDCYLCPGNTRANQGKNPDYKHTFVFDNDFPALLPEIEVGDDAPENGLLRAKPETGRCRVICYSPRHDLSMSRLDQETVARVVETWRKEYETLGSLPDINHVQVFENRGAMMGCSNPHPHGQIWANKTIPDIPSREGRRQKAHLSETGRCLLCDYLETERSQGERVVLKNDSFVALVPYWAVWPYEMMILPKGHQTCLSETSDRQQRDLADIMIRLAVRYDNLFKTSFPYSMGIHQKPTDGMDHPEWHFHLHFYPPLLRSATVRKFMVGYEMMAMPQRDMTAEQSAETLRNLSDVHYLDGGGKS